MNHHHQITELTGPALDWAVAKCEHPSAPIKVLEDSGVVLGHDVRYYFRPSTEWAHGGPIIEREISDIVVTREYEDPEGHVHAYINSNKPNEICCWGPTILIAAMRCYVLSKHESGLIALPEGLV